MGRIVPVASTAAPRILLTLALAVAQSACRGGGNGPQVIRDDSAGVDIVRYVGPDRLLAWTAEEILRLGGADSGAQAFFRVNPEGVAADGQGRLFILDEGAINVRVFAASGAYLSTLGREGGGPGEMKSPSGIFVNDEDVAVSDFGRGMLVRYDTQGAAMPEVVLPSDVARGSPIRPTANGGIIAQRDSVLGPIQPGALLFRSIVMYTSEADGSWQTPTELAQIQWQQPTFTPVGPEDCPMKIQTPPVFSRVPVWNSGPDRLVYNGWDDYRLDVIELGGRRASIRRDLPVQTATQEWAAREIGPSSFTFRGVDCTQEAEERAEQAGWEEDVPWIVDAALDINGRIWVRRRAPDEDTSTRIDLFAPDGEYLGTLPATFPFPDAWRAEDEIVTVERDSLGVPYVVVQRVREGG